ncbi:UPF0688 protein C1orf174 homolog [Eublepharis macularius]|uniref:UPF0688 protein C1orf174 homolog n=1 Tax=Eublepharis macularius TaxID=481883 RepID=A0AA97KK90_EUBMA|nr:UPF0688 protein C1orf174 homolog [Eublepharis macularius]
MRARRGPSHKATDRRPPKKLKCEKRNQAKLNIHEVDVCGNSSSIFSKEPTSKTPEVNEHLPNSPVLKIMLQNDGKAIPKISDESQVSQANLRAESSAPSAKECSQKTEPLFLPHVQNVDEEEEGEEESCGTGCSDDSEMEPEEPQDCLLEPDNSAFLNEDSNQPLPVDRFFGSVAFLQDLPAAPLIRAPANRREFRKMHFIAKEDDEDEDNEDVV